MAKKLYVDGGILINTRFFTCINAGCLYNERGDRANDICRGSEVFDNR